jgi:hypothetical protein
MGLGRGANQNKGGIVSKKNVTAIISGAGWIGSFADGLIKELRKRKVSDEGIHSLVTRNGELPIGKIADVLAEMVKKVSTFPIFKTIKLGTGLKNADDFCKALKANGHRIGNWGNNILGKPAFTTADKETEIDLVVVSNSDLGFKEGAYLKDTYKRALELGLVLCPNEVGPQLRLQYTDQPMNEWLLIAMESIEDSGGGLSVFSVERFGDGSWLGGSSGHPGSRWDADDRFVFALPRK